MYDGGSHEATAAQSPDSRRMAFWVEREGGLETESRMPPAKWATLRAWVMGEGAEGGYGGGVASISLMKAVLIALLLKAEAMQEMKRSR